MASGYSELQSLDLTDTRLLEVMRSLESSLTALSRAAGDNERSFKALYSSVDPLASAFFSGGIAFSEATSHFSGSIGAAAKAATYFADMANTALGSTVAAASPDVWSTFSRTIELLLAMFGSELIPTFIDGIKYLQELYWWWTSLDESTRDSVISIAGWVTGIIPAIQIVDAMIDAIQRLIDKMDELGVSVDASEYFKEIDAILWVIDKLTDVGEAGIDLFHGDENTPEWRQEEIRRERQGKRHHGREQVEEDSYESANPNETWLGDVLDGFWDVVSYLPDQMFGSDDESVDGSGPGSEPYVPPFESDHVERPDDSESDRTWLAQGVDALWSVMSYLPGQLFGDDTSGTNEDVTVQPEIMRWEGGGDQLVPGTDANFVGPPAPHVPDGTPEPQRGTMDPDMVGPPSPEHFVNGRMMDVVDRLGRAHHAPELRVAGQDPEPADVLDRDQRMMLSFSTQTQPKFTGLEQVYEHMQANLLKDDEIQQELRNIQYKMLDQLVEQTGFLKDIADKRDRGDGFRP